MPFFVEYILKLSISLAVVYLFYQLVLRRLTFYNWNRWYLLGYTMLSFLVPFIDISFILEQSNISSENIIYVIPALKDITSSKETSTQIPGITDFLNSEWGLSALIILAGIMFLLVRLVFQLLSYKKMLRKSNLIAGKGVRIYNVDMPIIPFSFGSSIFINQQLHTAEELQEIIRHEFVHVKQKHTIDILWGEILCIVNWFNPFVWLIRKAIRQNLEFIADNKVVEGGLDKKQYQYLLLKVIGNNHFNIASQFNFSSLKKRIAMMNKMRSAKLHLIKFLFVLPLVTVMLVAFRNKNRNPEQPQKNAISKESQSLIQITNHPIDSVPDAPINDQGYFIDIIGDKGNCTVVVKDKNKKEVKRLLLTEWDANKYYYEKLYGEILAPPPPPPPVPPMPPPPKLPENISSLSIDYNKAIIVLKNGNREEYDLNNVKQKASFEKKYGEILVPPPPPPVPTSPTLKISGTIKGDIPPTKANDWNYEFNKMVFTADAIRLNAKDRTLHLKGTAQVTDEVNEVNITADLINVEALASVPVIINGKKAEWNKDYINEKGEKYKVNMLKKEEAIKKYGDKGKNGVLEINSVVL